MFYEFYSHKYDLPKGMIQEKHDEFLKERDIKNSVYLFDAVSMPPSNESIQRSYEKYLLEGRFIFCFDLFYPYKKKINPNLKDKVLNYYRTFDKKRLEDVEICLIEKLYD
jgi:hypothetical protein